MRGLKTSRALGTWNVSCVIRRHVSAGWTVRVRICSRHGRPDCQPVEPVSLGTPSFNYQWPGLDRSRRFTHDARLVDDRDEISEGNETNDIMTAAFSVANALDTDGDATMIQWKTRREPTLKILTRCCESSPAYAPEQTESH
jgi:hypothetical protein